MSDVMTLAEAIEWLHARCAARPPEKAPLRRAAGRVLAAPVALAPAPSYPTAAIDGFAVRATETEGASDYAPLTVAGVPVRAGDAMPPVADAVLPPYAYDNGTALLATGRGGNVHQPGHDVGPRALLPAGTVLTALHLALLPADPVVRARTRVAAPCLASLQALVAATGAVIDDAAPDLALLAEPPSPPAWTPHARALAIRPGGATAIGLLGPTPAIVLPRHPADTATLFALLAAPVLRRLAGLPDPHPLTGRLTRKITSSLGLLDAVRVRLEAGAATPLGPAEGIGLLAAAGADGLVLVPEGSEGYPAGAMVPIYPL